MGWQTDIFPLLIVNASGGFTGLFAYSPAPGAGNLIGSVTSAGGTDPYGNIFLGGITSYANVGGAFYATNANGGVLNFLHAPTESSGWTFDGTFQSGSLSGEAGTIGANTALLLSGIAAPGAPPAGNGLLYADTAGFLRMLAGLAGDTNNYTLAKLIQKTANTQAFTLAAATPITGLSLPLGIGSYHLRHKVFFQASGTIGSTHTHALAFSGTATGNVNGACWQAGSAGAVTQGSLNNGALTAGLTSSTHLAFPGWADLEADITVTAAGTLTSTVALTTAGDGITTSPGTMWELTPQS